jgi:hypothetical protein
MTYHSFIYITTDVVFQEANKKGAKVFGTFMELEKPSQNGRIYRFVEGAKIAKSLIGKTVRFGADWLGKHILQNPAIGTVSNAWQEGHKIKGIVSFTDKGIISQLKKGAKFLFSVGGVAEFAELVRKGKKVFTKLHNAVCTHLQLLPNNPDGAGFPSAKMHKVIEINESVMLTRNFGTSTSDESAILRVVEEPFNEAAMILAEVESKVLNMAVARDIALVIEDVMHNPWKYRKS